MQWVEQALKLKPKDPFYLNNRGYVYLLLNDMRRALEDINLSISLDPSNAWAYRNKGIYYLMNNNVDDAVRLLTQAEQMEPFVEKINYYLGLAYQQKGELKKASEYFDKSSALNELGTENRM